VISGIKLDRKEVGLVIFIKICRILVEVNDVSVEDIIINSKVGLRGVVSRCRRGTVRVPDAGSQMQGLASGSNGEDLERDLSSSSTTVSTMGIFLGRQRC
jgi:hypothetical protein